MDEAVESGGVWWNLVDSDGVWQSLVEAEIK